MDPSPAFALSVSVGQSLLMLGIGICFIRLVRGPSLPDRVVALDLSTTLVVGMIALNAIATNQTVFLRTAIVITLLSFLGTVAFAIFIGKGGDA